MTIKVLSYNVGGLMGFLNAHYSTMEKILRYQSPDLICIQEVRMKEPPKNDLIDPSFKYDIYTSVVPNAGVLCMVKKSSQLKVHSVLYHEGRVIHLVTNYGDILNVYAPNSGSGLERRLTWNGWLDKYLSYIEGPLTIVGDLNVIFDYRDVWNGENSKAAGASKCEMEDFSKIIDNHCLTDSFRDLYPSKVAAYTYWSIRTNARQLDKGMRLDHVLTRGVDIDSFKILKHYNTWGDHCPIVVTFK